MHVSKSVSQVSKSTSVGMASCVHQLSQALKKLLRAPLKGAFGPTQAACVTKAAAAAQIHHRREQISPPPPRVGQVWPVQGLFGVKGPTGGASRK